MTWSADSKLLAACGVDDHPYGVSETELLEISVIAERKTEMRQFIPFSPFLIIDWDPSCRGFLTLHPFPSFSILNSYSWDFQFPGL